MCIRHAPPTPKRALPIAMIEPALLARLMPCASRAPRVGPRSRRARARAVPEAPIARPAHEERARALRAPARQEQLHGWSAPRNWTHARASCDTAMSGVRRIHGTPGSTARYIRAVSSSGSPRPLRLSRTRPPETDDHPAPHEIANPRISTIASTLEVGHVLHERLHRRHEALVSGRDPHDDLFHGATSSSLDNPTVPALPRAFNPRFHTDPRNSSRDAQDEIHTLCRSCEVSRPERTECGRRPPWNDGLMSGSLLRHCEGDAPRRDLQAR